MVVYISLVYVICYLCYMLFNVYDDQVVFVAKMGSLVPGHQGTGALGPGPRAFFILFYFLFWREFFFH